MILERIQSQHDEHALRELLKEVERDLPLDFLISNFFVMLRTNK